MIRAVTGLFIAALTCALSPLLHAASIDLEPFESGQFSPANGERTLVRFTVSHDGQAAVRMLDRRAHIVREWQIAQVEANQPASITWDGKDQNGEIVPDGAYFASIEFTGIRGETTELNPFSSALPLQQPVPTEHEAAAQSLNFELPYDALVNVRAGIAAGGPMLTTIVNWQALPAGTHSVPWNGQDADGTINIAEHPDHQLFTQAVPLPPGGVFATGHPTGERTVYSALHPELARSAPGAEQLRFSSLDAVPATNLNPRFDLTFTPSRTGARGELILQPTTTVVLRLEEDIKVRVTESRYEILIFINNRFVAEIEEGRSPARLPLDLNDLPEGPHLLTVNVITLSGSMAARSTRFVLEP